MMETLALKVGRRLAQLRRESGYSVSDVEKALTLGAGWIEAFEAATVPLTLDTVSALASFYGASLENVLEGVKGGASSAMPRVLEWSSHPNGVRIEFPYGKHDAGLVFPGASPENIREVVEELRLGLADEHPETSMSDAVASAFALAVEVMPNSNPSDLWYFLVQRAFLDPLNHPARNSRLDHSQSWKRTGGWALEKVVVGHYKETLADRGIEISVLDGDDKRNLRSEIEISDRVEVDKIDVVLRGLVGKTRHFFGVVHVKASFAERRTDDVPLSTLLIRHGYFSPLWTMDAKATPGVAPINRGELGANDVQGSGRSAKRKDIEDDASFSACFSYNSNTKPTPEAAGTAARIYACDFSRNPQDPFVVECQRAWDRFRTEKSL